MKNEKAASNFFRDCGSGDLQKLQLEAADFSAKVLSFCKALGGQHYRLLAVMLKPLKKRLLYGVKEELIPLRRLTAGLSALLARKLFDAGFKRAEHFTDPRKRGDLEWFLEHK